MRALVAGAGIGGLAAAIAIRQAGHGVAVFEQAERLEELGAGLAVSANARKALAVLGLHERVAARGADGTRLVLRSSDGTLLSEFSLDPGDASLGIHRADLQEELIHALGAEHVRLAARCTGCEEHADGVTLHIADASPEHGDFLIGADGIRSVIRADLYGEERLRYAGYVGWRAVAEMPAELITHGEFWETWGVGVRFGFVDIGHGRAYWFVADTVPEHAPPPAEQPKEALTRRFVGWHEPISEVIAATPADATSRTFIYDRRPSRRWGRGRVTLVGDAAHAMTPNLGQGASQALEDAAVLGYVLRRGDDIAAALREYERLRTRRANAVVRRSWQLGRVAQATNPAICRVRNRALRLLPDRLQKAQQERLLAFELPTDD